MSQSRRPQLVTTQAAAEKLGISPAQFSRICRARGYAPNHVEHWKHGRRSGERHLWAARTLAALSLTKEVKVARERRAKLDAAVAAHRLEAERRQRQEARYKLRLPGKVAALFGSPSDALPAACEAMWALNRSRFARVSYGLKSALIKHLYDAERFTDRVERLTRVLPPKVSVCWSCDGGGCYRCDETGDYYLPSKEVVSYVFAFTINDRKYVWQQPDFAMTWMPKIEATRVDDSSVPPPTRDMVRLSDRRSWSLRALVEFAVSEPLPPPAPFESAGEDDEAEDTGTSLSADLT
jgi:hypothetical protein